LKEARRLDRQVRARVLNALEWFAARGHGDVNRLRGSRQ
jgi:hypothetical protein